MVTMQPLTMTVPTPVNTVPLQQKRYSPVAALNRTTLAGLLSSCRQALNTVTVNVQVEVLPDASVAVQVTVVVPTGKTEPDGGEQETVTPGQLSLAIGAGKVTALPLEMGQAETPTLVWLGGQVIVGGWVSLTVTLKLHDGPSITVQVTVVIPTWKKLPGAGTQVDASPQLDVGSVKLTFAPHIPVVLGTTMSDGQLRIGVHEVSVTSLPSPPTYEI